MIRTLTHQSKQPMVFKNIIKIFRVIWSISPVLFVFNSIFYIATALIPLMNLYIMKEIIDAIVEIIRTNKGILKGVFLLILQASISIFTLIIESLHRLINLKLKQKVDFSFQDNIMNKAGKLPLVFFDSPEYYNKIERSAAAEERGLDLFSSSFRIIQSTITLIGFLIMLFNLSWILPLCMMILIIPPLWVNIWLGKQRYNQVHEQTPTQRRVNYLNHILKSRNAAKELRLFQHEDYLRNKWKKLLWKNNNEQFNLEKKAESANAYVNSAREISNIIFVGSLLYITTKGRLTVGDYFIFSQGITYSLSLISEISEEIANLHESAVFMNDYFGYINLEEEDLNSKPHSFSFEDEIVVSNISYSYPNNQKKVLDNISFNIRKGEKVAVVGKNGAGKSTLINCIIGLYTPTHGTVAYDGINVKNIDTKEIRKKISAIFQDFVHYQLTVRENIAISEIRNLNNNQKLSETLKMSNSDFVNSLLYKYDTELGTAFSGGQELSGGQWQKIGLARALFKDSDIIILDEPTAALDPASESEILKKFIDVTENKTGIFITHRLGICKNVDRVLVMDNGKLIEQGTHQELLESNGEYARMFDIQSEWYVTKELVTL
ncbi:ABC transporter ATP-binding protein [Rossellomorea arthrocnemi]|uniref:ABC transporter ATP-binding protein n=1 Tax=Rossellomorea arthrocnemi TaxID=2769542 RepID=UPI00191A4D9F|nr:ABC transporter ATP-binding protein [Rossellomorea arthrocnemi]